MRFFWHWRRDRDEATRQREQAKTQYEWAVANRTTVSDIVSRLVYHGEVNGVVENLNKVIRGGHK